MSGQKQHEQERHEQERHEQEQRPTMTSFLTEPRATAAVRLAGIAGAGLVMALATAWPAPALATDVAAGEKIAGERCAACHGKDGNTPIDPSYPKLGGQYADYLVVTLKSYRSERRKNAIMGAQAKALSNADIDNLAAYYANLPSQLSVRK
jgi:cytochrome c553